jgi:hypothetical protein
LAETAKRLDCPAVVVGGTDDHVHLLIRLGRTITIADLVKELKRSSTTWMKVAVPSFAWQAGYGAFSVGLSNIEAVESYILRQEDHHQHFSFVEEYCRSPPAPARAAHASVTESPGHPPTCIIIVGRPLHAGAGTQ